MAEQCPCGGGKEFSACCGPLLAGEEKAGTAEALMRSRYSAFVKNDMGYLERTLDARKRGSFHAGDVADWNADVRWTGLTILETRDGGPDDKTGVVEFKADYKKGGEPAVLHERSRFKKKGGAWFYVDGAHGGEPERKPAASAKVGRNAPCPCGSGKKFKRCCG